jgi:hypothetical protein
MCAIMTWGTHEYFMHPIFVLKNGCDNYEIYFHNKLIRSHEDEYYSLETWVKRELLHATVTFFSGHCFAIIHRTDNVLSCFNVYNY